jgi:hypothetical protein
MKTQEITVCPVNDQAETQDNANEPQFHMPTLSAFMALISAEESAVASTPSGYNVYNKYNKTS